MEPILHFIGRLHPLWVHLPIGFLLMAIIFQWLSSFRQYAAYALVVRFAYAIAAIASVFACISGWVLAQNESEQGTTLDWHRWMGIALAIIACFASIFFNKMNSLVKKMNSMVLFILLSWVGHLGGTLTHGEGYLSFEDSSAKDTLFLQQQPIANLSEAVLYKDMVQPLLDQKCVSCHGPKKQKGNLRLDAPEWIQKGGKTEKAWVDGNAQASEITKRILLDPLDEKHMAPKGKPQLSESERNLLVWWINSKAGFQQPIKALSPPSNLAAYLQSLTKPAIATSLPDLPRSPVAPASEQSVAQLRKEGILVLPVSKETNYLQVNFISVSKITDSQIALLNSIANQLVWLKMDGVTLSPASYQVIGHCKNLCRLSINHSNFGDQQLPMLSQMPSLVYLNLVGHQLSAEGLKKIKALPIKRLYY